MGEFVRVVGALVNSHAHVDQVLPKAELDGMKSGEIKAQFTANPRHFFLAMEAHRYRFASLYDPLLAMNTSKVDPLPHQIEAVYGRILQYPRIRFLIADDPGAGKTIMAGLIIKELKLRHLARRILIVTPGHLKDQWRRELKDRFEEIFTVVDRSFMSAFYGQNVWSRESQLITSIDFAKQDDILIGLTSAQYDLIIVDEAHKMSAYKYGEKLDKTIRYRLGERLSEACTHLLFLTATPHRGDPENFRLFLDLLEPGFFATTDMVAESIHKQENPLFIRRLKEDMKDFEGRDIFLPRHVQTKPFNLGVESYAEKDLYNNLSRYVKEQFNKALNKDKRRNVAFALVILQRRLASSTFALLRSLERRKKRMEDLLQGAENKKRNNEEYDIDEVDDLTEEERWEREDVWETLSVAESRQEFEEELKTLDNLIRQARVIVNSDPPVEAKLRHFKDALEELEQMQPRSKILIFTESRDTLEYLQKNLERWNYNVCTIHGGMGLEERIQAEAIFKNEAQVLVATEAAGEGINLQFCNLMINYDIPWNPNRLEQRMGRIHRYGQTREVFIFNLVATDTREGQVLKALFDKLEEIRDALGSDKVFDVLGDIIQGKDLGQLLVEAAAGARSMDEIMGEIEIKVDADYIASVRAQLGDSLATRFIDYTRINDMADQAREHRLIPEYTEAYFKRAMETLNGKWQPRKVSDYPLGSFLSLESVPTELKYIGDEDSFKKQFGPLLKRYPLATFDKDASMRVPQAELITFGDPMFEAMLTWVERKLYISLKEGTVFTDPDGGMNGTLLFYQGEIRDGQNEIAGTRLFALFVNEERGSITPVNPAILWDLQEGGQTRAEEPSLDALQNRAISFLLPEMEGYRQELLQERQRQAAIKEKYGSKSLDMLILKLDGDLIGLYTRRDQGDNVDLAIRNKEEQKKHYENASDELKESLERERNLTLSTPNFLGAARIIPATGMDEMYNDPDVERIAMQVTLEYELAQGRNPVDVSKENLGYDVRSTGKEGERRYIEVKGRAGSGSVSLTQNEWFKARRFQEEFHLYAVMNTTSTPILYMVQNPAGLLKPEEQVEVRYLVSLRQLTSRAERVIPALPKDQTFPG